MTGTTQKSALKDDAAEALAVRETALAGHVTPCRRAPKLWTDGP